MTHPAAKGERFLAVAGDFLSMLDIAKILKSTHGRVRQNAFPLASFPTGSCASPLCAILQSS